ncbi:hypothetical protein MSS93_17385 (plasmid) [Deinococcus radiodurans]|nr:hypothetical protein MSS93_17385 [Deinococcus radiodurans]
MLLETGLTVTLGALLGIGLSLLVSRVGATFWVNVWGSRWRRRSSPGPWRRGRWG